MCVCVGVCVASVMKMIVLMALSNLTLFNCVGHPIASALNQIRSTALIAHTFQVDGTRRKVFLVEHIICTAHSEPYVVVPSTG